MSNEPIKDQRIASEIMGRQLVTTERFIVNALMWLGIECENFTLERTEDDCWLVRSAHFAAGDDTLADALCGAVFAQDAYRNLPKEESC